MLTGTAKQPTSLPWYIEDSGTSKKKGRLTIADYKRLVPISKLLVEYGMPTQFDVWSDEWVTVPCPFHDDTHPSASMNPRLGRFRCHTCDIGGDVVGIVKEVEDFRNMREAMEWLMTTFNL